MGDTRFQAHYDRLKRAKNTAREIYAMDDDELIQALAGGTADPDSQYLMNVLASEALNRVRRARLVEQHIAEGVFSVDGEGRITTANPAAQDMLGRSEAELRGLPLVELCERTAAGEAEHVCAFMRVLEEGNTIEHSEERFRCRDGRVVEVAYTAAPVLAEGVIVGAVIAWRDVSASLEWQRRIIESEARYRSLFENSTELIMSLDKDGYITALNPAGERVTGYRSDAIRGMRVLPFLRAEDQGRAQQSLANVIAGETTHGSFEIIDAHGGTRVLDIIGVPIVVGSRVVGVHGVARDITETRRLEMELRESELRHRLAAEGLRDEAVIFLAPSGTILSWSPGARRVFGWREEQVRGASYALLFSPELAAAGVPQKQLAEAAELGDLPINGEHVQADGTPVHASGLLRCVRGAAGGAAGYVVVLRRRPHEREGTVVIRGDRIEAAGVTFAELVGRTPVDLIGTPLREVVHPDDRARLERTMLECKAGDVLDTQACLGDAGQDLLNAVSIDVRRLETGKGEPCWVLLCRRLEDAP